MILCATLLMWSLLAVALAAEQPVSAATQISRVDPGQGKVALTFDADAWPGRITAILNALRRHDTRITFFLTGNYLVNFPRLAKQIHQAGHEIASHGYEHRDYRGLSGEQIAQRLDRWQETFEALTGERGPSFWRAPYGYSDSRVRQAALDKGFSTIYWTLDTQDTIGPPKSRSFIVNRVLNTSWLKLDGAIVLLHVNANGSVDALDEILATLKRRGLRAVTVSELLER